MDLTSLPLDTQDSGRSDWEDTEDGQQLKDLRSTDKEESQPPGQQLEDPRDMTGEEQD